MINMYVEDLFDLSQKALSYFGPKALFCGDHLPDDATEGDEGYAQFLLYNSYAFGFGFMDPPYTSLAFFLIATDRITTTQILGKDLLFTENQEKDVQNAFRVMDEYCRLRLPDKFLQVYDAL
ncbi:hypothetical protein [Glaciibacter psychrotolerans]|uniref:Uncharacterized protein n=1 Tax=Glaciibacter psychrotolerans TaxID=670054 RepID=A0A7Z0EGG2_9MICO|nr:hypothetical protein [Leifsonia psychrotolerans]NYJ21046.1 hypothetical protein [Leifsonia psychrotolerans]